jgi:predicted dinucleotide-binding enzyme
MRIGIIGAGKMGGTLGRHLAGIGHRVLIANSRGLDSLTALAASIGATPASVPQAVIAAEVVILAIPTKAVPALPEALFADAPATVAVIDTGNYHPELHEP